MKYSVFMKKRFEKVIREMPESAQETLLRLVDDIGETGPVQPLYPNYSKLREGTYHCHLAYKWVACWKRDGRAAPQTRENAEKKILVEVYYVGSREKAPY